MPQLHDFKYKVDNGQYKTIKASSEYWAKKVARTLSPYGEITVKPIIDKNYHTGFEKWS